MRMTSVRRISIARATPASPAGGQAIGVRAADQHRARAEAEGLHDVAPRADAAVHQDLDWPSPRPRSPAARGWSAATVSSCRPPWFETTMALGALVDRAPRVVAGVDALHHDGPCQASRIHVRSAHDTIDCSSAAPTSA